MRGDPELIVPQSEVIRAIVLVYSPFYSPCDVSSGCGPAMLRELRGAVVGRGCRMLLRLVERL